MTAAESSDRGSQGAGAGRGARRSQGAVAGPRRPRRARPAAGPQGAVLRRLRRRRRAPWWPTGWPPTSPPSASTLVLIVVAFFIAAGLNPVGRVDRAPRRTPSLRGDLRDHRRDHRASRSSWSRSSRSSPTRSPRSPRTHPGWLDQLQRNRQIQDLDDEYQIIEKIRDYVTDGDFLSTLFGGALGFGLAVLGALFNGFIVLVLTLYFLSSLATTKTALYRLAPASRRDRVSRLGDRIIRSVGGYVSGAFVVAMCAGISSLVFLFIVGLGEYAVALAFVVALLDVIPMIGATIGAVIVTAIAFAEDPKIGIACAIFYLIYQQVENYVIYPRVMSKSVDVPGAVTVIAALIGAALLGVVGALLAIPTAAAHPDADPRGVRPTAGRSVAQPCGPIRRVERRSRQPLLDHAAIPLSLSGDHDRRASPGPRGTPGSTTVSWVTSRRAVGVVARDRDQRPTRPAARRRSSGRSPKPPVVDLPVVGRRVLRRRASWRRRARHGADSSVAPARRRRPGPRTGSAAPRSAWTRRRAPRVEAWRTALGRRADSRMCARSDGLSVVTVSRGAVHVDGLRT